MASRAATAVAELDGGGAVSEMPRNPRRQELPAEELVFRADLIALAGALSSERARTGEQLLELERLAAIVRNRRSQAGED